MDGTYSLNRYAHDMTGMRGLELITRNSIHSIHSPSIGSVSTDHSKNVDHNLWRLDHLRDRFMNTNLETLFRRYQQRLMHIDLRAYLLLQMFISFGYIIMILVLNIHEESNVVPEATGQCILFVLSGCIFGLAYQEVLVRKYPQLHLMMSVTMTGFLLTVDVGLLLWFGRSDEVSVRFVPSSFYTILVVYNLLPYANIWQSVLLGLLVGLIHIVVAVLVPGVSTFSNTTPLIVSDVIYLLVANVFGILTKCLKEITMRRAFLDRRRCIETTIKLNYEKSQEEELMNTILPKHIASEVREDIREEFQLVTGEKSIMSKKPFDKLYVEEHKEVTILFADIVNFTPLTTILAAGALVALLNDLYGKFDEAANPYFMRKILNYSCVSGIRVDTPESTIHHAKNCVEMGFKMIEIIRQVRRDHKVDIDMRIGIHSGTVISGLLGLRKWQFDIWGTDVTIANHMESSGKPGRIHVSMITKQLLGEEYRFEPAFGHKRSSYLENLGIETYLVETNSIPEDANPSDDDQMQPDVDVKKIKFRLERIVSTDLSFNETVHDGLKLDQNDSDSSMESLYVKFPDNLENVPSNNSRHYSESFSSQLNISTHFTKLRRKSGADEQSEEIYSRMIKNPARKYGSFQATAIARAINKRRSTTGENNIRRGAVLMDSSLRSFRQMMNQADANMEKAIEKMSLSKFRSKNVDHKPEVNFFLFFNNRLLELPFLSRHDPLFHLYIFGAFPALVGILSIQILLFGSKLHWFWVCFGIFLSIATLIAVTQWAPSFWINRKTRNPSNDSNESLSQIETIVSYDSESAYNSELQRSPVSRFFAKLNIIRQSLTTRIILFILVCFSIGASSIADINVVVLNVTTKFSVGSCEDEYADLQFDPRIYLWYFTYSAAMAMTVAFGYFRVHFLMKLSFYVVVLITYALLLNVNYPLICEIFTSFDICSQCKASLALTPELSHIIYLVTILLVLHVADRQIEFIHRLDFVEQDKLDKEQKEADTTRMVNKLLLLNILPLHVAEVYVDRTFDELYHEEYKFVACLFASIPNFMDYFTQQDSTEGGLHCLEFLNHIISGFDALSFEDSFSRIEKIKVVGSTYMAACGLASSRYSRKGSNISNSEMIEIETSPINFLLTLVKFAASMSVTLNRLNRKQSHNFQLRTGIDYGPVIAGVVGAQKPFYDVWGNTVNMASRLEYSGELGKIQVTKKTAVLLEREGIQCERRGETYLKGKGKIVTYWVYPERAKTFYESLPRAPSIRRSSLLGVGDYAVSMSARHSLVTDEDDVLNKGKLKSNQKPKNLQYEERRVATLRLQSRKRMGIFPTIDSPQLAKGESLFKTARATNSEMPQQANTVSVDRFNKEAEKSEETRL